MPISDWVNIIEGVAIVYFAYQQNQIFKRQNEIFASQAGQRAMPDKTSRLLQLKQYWPTVVMVVLMMLTGYDIYDRHARASYIIPWWSYGLALLLIGAAIGTAVRRQEKPPSPISKLMIHSALYGVGDAADVVVTDKLNGITKEGLVVPVNNNLADHDPAPNKSKRLKVEYKYDAGDPRTVIVPEHGWLMLPENPQLLKLKTDVEILQKRIDSAATQDAPQFSDLAKRVLNLASHFKHEVTQFRGGNPEPRSPSTLILTRHASSASSPMFGRDDLKNGITEHNAWKERAAAWYRHNFMRALEGVRDELGAQGLTDSLLNTAITETGLDKENTALIVQRLRSLALQLDDDPQERGQKEVILPLTENDPRIRLETISVPSDIPGFTSDHFVLYNEGGSTAYRVKIEDIDLSSKLGNVIARCHTEETILADHSTTVVPWLPVDDASFTSLLLKYAIEADTEAETKNIIITYYDYNGNEFKTGAELAYVPLASETPSEIAKDFSDVARQYLRKNPPEVVVERKERRAAGVSDIVVRNLRYWKVGRV
jgi:hypothetical protein